MKNLIRVLLFAFIISAGSIKTNETKAQSASVSFSVFYNSLRPYGRWEKHPTYGEIWVSNVSGFSPYSTGGHWAYTDYGWTWVSTYDWGWAPFHYGRWTFDAGYGGWFWVPGYEWAPAWVAWRGGGDYYGWAPLSPGLNISIGVSYNSIPSERWVFAPHRYITSPYINRYYVPRSRNVTIIRNTTVVNNVTVKNNVHYVAGPARADVEKVNHTKIKTYTVSNSSRPGKTVVNNNTVNVYRPVINNNKTVVNKNQTTIDKDNSKTTLNNNSNNKIVTNNSNKTTVNKSATKNTTTNDKTVNKESTNKTLKQEPQTPNKITAKQHPVNTNKEPVNKKPQENKNPAVPDHTQVNDNKQKVKPAQNSPIVKTKPVQQPKKEQQKQNQDVAKKKKPSNDNNNNR